MKSDQRSQRSLAENFSLGDSELGVGHSWFLWVFRKVVFCLEICIYTLIAAHLHYLLLVYVILRELPNLSELWFPYVKIGNQFPWTHSMAVKWWL